MQSKTVIELLALKLSGEATLEELAELERLMAENPEVVYHEELLRQVFINKEEEDNTDLEYNRHRLKYQNKLIFAEQNITAFNHLKVGNYIIAACSVVLILIVARLFIFQNKYDKNSTRFNTEVIAGKAERKKVVLPDGTQVWLNSDSRLLYDKDMGKRNLREVKLSGEAFFDVTHNKSRPFIIKTNKISVRVLGTAFNIKAYPKDQKTETTLLRGSIELTVNNRNTQKVMLKPSEKFALIDQKVKTSNQQDKSGQDDSAENITMMIQNVLPVKVSGKEYTEEVSWVDNQLVFKNETFEELAPKLERWYNVKLTIEDSSINAYHFTGVFTNENLTDALTALKLIKPFTFKIKAHEVTIY
jgi:transmembrane sensor